MVSTEQDSGNVSAQGAVTSSATSLSLAAAQPARGEFQRYSGHPATTCLSPVLGWLWGLPTGPLPTKDPKLMEFKNAIYKISPYTPSHDTKNNTDTDGGSLGATDNPDDARPDGKGMASLTDQTPKLNEIGRAHV